MVGDEGLGSPFTPWDVPGVRAEFRAQKMVGDEGLEPPTFSV